MAGGAYTDDSTIPNHAALWRRIPPGWFVYDENLDGWRPSSAAFQDHPNGTPMSVSLADIVVKTDRGPRDVLKGHIGFTLASITAGLARENGQGVAREPLPEEPAHGVVFGRKTKHIRKRLARGSEWVIRPPDRI